MHHSSNLPSGERQVVVLSHGSGKRLPQLLYFCRFVGVFLHFGCAVGNCSPGSLDGHSGSDGVLFRALEPRFLLDEARTSTLLSRASTGTVNISDDINCSALTIGINMEPLDVGSTINMSSTFPHTFRHSSSFEAGFFSLIRSEMPATLRGGSVVLWLPIKSTDSGGLTRLPVVSTFSSISSVDVNITGLMPSGNVVHCDSVDCFLTKPSHFGLDGSVDDDDEDDEFLTAQSFAMAPS